jgi:hypothetical protein
MLLDRMPTVELDNWLRYTMWNELFQGYNIVSVHEFVRMPANQESDDDDKKCVRLLRAWNQLLNRCIASLNSTTHIDALKWIGTPKGDATTPAQRPWGLPQNSTTLDKYSRIWEKFLCYMIRTAPKQRFDNKSSK